MGSSSIFVLLLITTYASAHFNGRVEFTSPPGTISATSYVQPVQSSQFVIPAVITPIVPEAVSRPPSVPSYPEFNDYNSPYMHPSMPPMPMPIFMGSRDDNDWHHLLYFLVFSNLRNRFNNGYGCNGNGGGCGCGCGNSGCGNSGCSCGNSGNSGCGSDDVCGVCGGYTGDRGCNGNSNVVYIPYPIPVPSNAPFYPTLFSGTVDTPQFPSDDTSFGPTIQACGGREPNEINLVIRTDSSK